MPTLVAWKKKNNLWQSNLPCQPRLRVPRRHAKVPPGRLSARHRATPANGSPGRTGFPKRISLQTRLAYGVCSCWCFYFLFSLKKIQRNKWHRSWGQKNCSKICKENLVMNFLILKSKHLLAWSPGLGLGILLGAEPSSTSRRFRSVLLKKTCCSYHGLIMIFMRPHIDHVPADSRSPPYLVYAPKHSPLSNASERVAQSFDRFFVPHSFSRLIHTYSHIHVIRWCHVKYSFANSRTSKDSKVEQTHVYKHVKPLYTQTVIYHNM